MRDISCDLNQMLEGENCDPFIAFFNLLRGDAYGVPVFQSESGQKSCGRLCNTSSFKSDRSRLGHDIL